MDLFNDKNILIIGGTGSIGERLVERLLVNKPKVLRIFSRDEYKQFELQDRLKRHTHIRYLLGDVRDKERLSRSMNGIDIVFDLAALKHVPACEYSPFEAVKTNVLGTQNVIEAAIQNNVDRVIYTSSDKAVSPTNTMGATKLLAERLISAADFHKGTNRTIFCAVRFGNVLGTRGSVIPLFINQIRRDRAIRITNPDMTRFMMTISQSVELMMKAAVETNGGEVRVLKMPALRLGDLAEVVVEMATAKLGLKPEDVQTEIMGLRTGEKMYEELLSDHELLQAEEQPDMFIIHPFHRWSSANRFELDPVAYNSEFAPKLSKEQIRQMLIQEQILE